MMSQSEIHNLFLEDRLYFRNSSGNLVTVYAIKGVHLFCVTEKGTFYQSTCQELSRAFDRNYSLIHGANEQHKRLIERVFERDYNNEAVESIKRFSCTGGKDFVINWRYYDIVRSAVLELTNGNVVVVDIKINKNEPVNECQEDVFNYSFNKPRTTSDSKLLLLK